MTQSPDKYEVRKHVEHCGFDYLLNDIIAVWDSVDEINWNELPERFAIKGNHSNGHNLICDDKSKLNINKAEKEFNRWLADEYWKLGDELNYENI